MTGEHDQNPWWKTRALYQVYIRSFFDTNKDGIGDINGVTAKLDYLRELGIGGIWLSPITKSANYDLGYDVTDYYSVDPELGTLEDLDRLITQAHHYDIKVILDFVPNHTSIYHPWFQDALTSKRSEYRDYYIWHDPKQGGLRRRAPNNWRSMFGGSAWKYHRGTGQYYLHTFLSQQADLNWRNPKVQEEFSRIMRFWLDRGVDGFRIDVFNSLIKAANQANDPILSNPAQTEDRILGQTPLHIMHQPELHPILRSWHKIAESYENIALLGEPFFVKDYAELAGFYGKTGRELDLVFDFSLLYEPFNPRRLAKVVADTEGAFGRSRLPLYALSNHDQPRVFGRWAAGDERKQRLAFMMLGAIRGTPMFYYGDEIGMDNVHVPRRSMRDNFGKALWPLFPGRDRARTPMQWEHTPGAGFTNKRTRPWLPFGDYYKFNVFSQISDPSSILFFVRRLLKLRNSNKVLQLGKYKEVEITDTLWRFQRGGTVDVILNFANEPQTFKLRGNILLSTVPDHKSRWVEGSITLEAYEGIILER